MKRSALIRRTGLRRTPIRRWTRAEEDKVTPETAAAVFKRDQGCMAPRLGGSSMDCWGKDRLEHVKKEPRAGVRAEPWESRLLVLCQGHTEDGMKAGYIWCVDRRNREACREYLRYIYEPTENGLSQEQNDVGDFA